MISCKSFVIKKKKKKERSFSIPLQNQVLFFFFVLENANTKPTGDVQSVNNCDI